VSGCEHHAGSPRFGNDVSEGFYVELIDSLHISLGRLATKPTK
jgi:hypothetical protein